MRYKPKCKEDKENGKVYDFRKKSLGSPGKLVGPGSSCKVVSCWECQSRAKGKEVFEQRELCDFCSFSTDP